MDGGGQEIVHRLCMLNVDRRGSCDTRLML